MYFSEYKQYKTMKNPPIACNQVDMHAKKLYNILGV
jgi:hypothetical protein